MTCPALPDPAVHLKHPVGGAGADTYRVEGGHKMTGTGEIPVRWQLYEAPVAEEEGVPADAEYLDLVGRVAVLLGSEITRIIRESTHIHGGIAQIVIVAAEDIPCLPGIQRIRDTQDLCGTRQLVVATPFRGYLCLQKIRPCRPVDGRKISGDHLAGTYLGRDQPQPGGGKLLLLYIYRRTVSRALQDAEPHADRLLGQRLVVLSP